MNIMQNARACMLVIASLLVVFQQTNAFQIQPKISCSTHSRLPSTALRVAEKKPRWTELPRSRNSKPELSGFEINIGRVAMLGFCGLLAREIVSGQSFGEQVIHAISLSSGTNLPI